MDIAYVEKTYSRWSNIYDLFWGKILSPGQKISIEVMDIQPGDKILEVGVGTGLSLPLYPDCCHVTGIDLSAEMLKKAQKKVEKYDLRHVSLEKMDAGNMDFEDNLFDTVIAAHVVSVVPDPVKVVLEMKRVCKKGGKILFLNHFKSQNKLLAQFEETISPLCDKIGFKTDLDVDKLLAITNLKVVHRRKINMFNYWQLVQCINYK
jgi:phosphatidylethanolamine/phosphatidyl-N-methylethanolamine N-methyltransferase